MHPTGHRGAHGQGARSQVDAQGWSGESGRTHSACHYTLAGFPALKVWRTHLKLSEPGERLLKHRASEPHHGEMFSYEPHHGGSLRPNCSGCQFRASDFAPLALAPSRSARRSAAQNKGNSQADYYQRTQDYERQIHGQRLS